MLGPARRLHPTNTRSKRAPFSFVGDIASSLFDVATNSDLKKVANHVYKLFNMQLRLSAVLYASVPDRICITIDVPVAADNTRFDVYHLLTFPVPFNDTSLHATRLGNGCSYCLIAVPCFCSLMAGPFRLSPRVQSCQDTTKITTWPGINLRLEVTFTPAHLE
ncbi:uncharacterized protein [Littorina saxatilis]|uniref:uncharacterized protein n=1 Tax=Littorina saxatilis TaxID=31220 RepID=UPI0038B4529E